MRFWQYITIAAIIAILSFEYKINIILEHCNQNITANTVHAEATIPLTIFIPGRAIHRKWLRSGLFSGLFLELLL